MKKICDICGTFFETKSSTRIYCYDCSGDSTIIYMKHEKIKRLFYAGV